jgi:hypothetical protein
MTKNFFSMPRLTDTLLITRRRFYALALAAPLLFSFRAGAAELRISRGALERTLQQQLFRAPDGRYYLKGKRDSPCAVYVEQAHLRFEKDRMIVQVLTHARMGKALGGTCLGLSLAPTAEVSLEPYGEGESIGFRDAQLIKVSDRRELNFLLAPFLRRQVPKSMEINAADLLRNSLAGSTASSGYKVTLDRLRVHSLQVDGDDLVVDVDGDLSIR